MHARAFRRHRVARATCAMPKSSTLTRSLPSSRRSTSTLSGLRSRWMMPADFAARQRVRDLRPISHTRRHGSCFCGRATRAGCARAPAASRSTRRPRAACRSRSRWRRWDVRTARVAMASRAKRAATSPLPRSSARTTFSATGLCSVRCSATNTRPSRLRRAAQHAIAIVEDAVLPFGRFVRRCGLRRLQRALLQRFLRRRRNRRDRGLHARRRFPEPLVGSELGTALARHADEGSTIRSEPDSLLDRMTMKSLAFWIGSPGRSAATRAALSAA